MVERLLVDLGADRHVSVSTRVDGRLPITATETASWTRLNPRICAVIWKDYPRAPLGVYEDRGRLSVERLLERGPRGLTMHPGWCRSADCPECVVQMVGRANTRPAMRHGRSQNEGYSSLNRAAQFAKQS
jgi:hypothetical protein